MAPVRLHSRSTLEPYRRPPASSLLLIWVFAVLAAAGVGGFLAGLGVAAAKVGASGGGWLVTGGGALQLVAAIVAFFALTKATPLRKGWRS